MPADHLVVCCWVKTCRQNRTIKFHFILHLALGFPLFMTSFEHCWYYLTQLIVLCKSLWQGLTARQQQFIIEPDPKSASFDALFWFVFFRHRGWGFFCHWRWRINIYWLQRNDAFSIGSWWGEAFVLPYEVWKVSAWSQTGVYTCRMIRCCLHHYSRNCALCLSIALFMLMLNGIFLSASNPELPICFFAYTPFVYQSFDLIGLAAT